MIYLLTGEEGKRYYVFIQDFDTFMYDYTPNHGRKYFCRYCLQAFNTKEILKRHVKIALKLIVNKGLMMPKKVIMLN